MPNQHAKEIVAHLTRECGTHLRGHEHDVQFAVTEHLLAAILNGMQVSESERAHLLDQSYERVRALIKPN